MSRERNRFAPFGTNGRGVIGEQRGVEPLHLPPGCLPQAAGREALRDEVVTLPAADGHASDGSNLAADTDPALAVMPQANVPPVIDLEIA